MSEARRTMQRGYAAWERLRHSLILLIFLDLVTLGLYSVGRHYVVHARLSEKTGLRPFSPAFLHILIVLNLLLWVLRFSRESMPGDLSVIMTQLGTGLLGISVLLIFRRALGQEFQLKIRLFPLAIFGFWYLQYAINRRSSRVSGTLVKDSWRVLAAVILLAVSLSFVRGMLKHVPITDSAMEPTLIAGDYVLVDRLSLILGSRPQRGDLLVHSLRPSLEAVQVKRALGLPGDRLGFQADQVSVNGQPLLCRSADPRPAQDAMEFADRRYSVCEIEGRSFTLQRFPQENLEPVQGEFAVPRDHYFVIGDNLDKAVDSRSLGSIPAASILGRVRWRTISYRAGESIPWDRWFHWL